MPTANEFCTHAQPTTARGKVWCSLYSQTVQRHDCCPSFHYNQPTHTYLKKEYPIK